MKFKKISKKEDISEEDLYGGYLIDSSEKEARKIIQSIKDLGMKKIIFLFGRDDLFNRRAIETLKIDYLISPERSEEKNSLKQRHSGINHYLAKEAAKRKIGMVIDFSEINKLSGKNLALRLEKIIQNIKICRKAKCPIILWDFSGKADKNSLASLGASLGMSSQQVRDSKDIKS